MELLKIWSILLRRRHMVVTVFAIFMAVVIIATYFSTPVYEAKAKILIESSDTLNSLMMSLGLATPVAMQKTSDSGTYSTDIAMTTIRPLLEKLISDLELKGRNGETLKPADLMKYSPAEILSPEPYLKVEQYEESDILEITAKSTDAEQVALIANSIAELHIQDRLDQKRKEYKVARLFIEDQIVNVENKYLTLLSEKEEFMVREKTVDLDVEYRSFIESISEMRTAYRNNEIALSQAGEKINLIEEKIKDKPYIPASVIENLESRLNELLVEISGQAVEFTSEDKTVKALSEQVQTIKELLRNKAEVDFDEYKVSISPVHNQLIDQLINAHIDKKSYDIQREILMRSIQETQDELSSMTRKKVKNSELNLTLNVYQELYQSLLGYLTELGIAESMALSNIKLVEPAIVPDDSDSPNIGRNYILGIFLSLFMACFFAFLAEYLDHNIRGTDDLEEYGFTFLGSIPRFKEFKGKRLVSNTDPNDPVYEAYRKVHSGIHFATLDIAAKKLLICSARSEAGSSTTAANIGILHASEGKKVLLIDADLRRPNLHRLFDLSNTEGLTNLLLEDRSLEDVVYETKVEGLSILPTGPTPPDTAVLLKSGKMGDVINTLKDRYDLLIFHCAPLLIKHDAVLLMRHLDSMAIVVRDKTTSRHSMSRVDGILRSSKIKPLGVILNFS